MLIEPEVTVAAEVVLFGVTGDSVSFVISCTESSEEKQFPFDSSETTWPTEGAPKSFDEAFSELERSGQQCGDATVIMDEEDNDMDHNPAICGDSESVSLILISSCAA